MSTGDDPYAERKKLSFEQAEGVEPLPAQLKLKEVSPRLRAALWRVVHDSLHEARIWRDYAPAATLKRPSPHHFAGMGLIALGLAAIDGRLVHMAAHDRSDG